MNGHRAPHFCACGQCLCSCKSCAVFHPCCCEPCWRHGVPGPSSSHRCTCAPGALKEKAS